MYLTRLLQLAVSFVLLGAALGFVGYFYGMANIVQHARNLSTFTLVFVFLALLINAFAAAVRFDVVARDIGHSVGIRRAMAAVGAGSLAGAVFFQIAGQLLARSAVLRDGNVPFSAVIIITAYERVVAAIVSGAFALGGALFIFGKIYLDRSAGGAELIKILCGLIGAMAGGAMLGYGRAAARQIAPMLTKHFVVRFLHIVTLTILVQLPTMAAYVIAAHGVSPNTPVSELFAASSIVMFAAAIPISLAGWGVREMSAVIALGAIGIASDASITAAILVGAGSMISMATIAAIAFPYLSGPRRQTYSRAGLSFDYTVALAWTLPCIAAILILFQIYVPVGAGLLNVNLADPIAILASALFMLKHFQQKHPPKWRVQYVNFSLVAMTGALTFALFFGALHFGWTSWAVVNRYCGWFILLSYGATGALIVNEAGGKSALQILLLTYVGAAIAVVGVDYGLILLKGVGVPIPANLVDPGNVQGFAQNRNFFAFQLLMALAAALVVPHDRRVRTALIAALLVGLYFTGSRSGWIATAAVIGGSIFLRALTVQDFLVGFGSAALIVLLVILLPTLEINQLGAIQANSPATYVPHLIPDEASTAERITSMLGGLKMFLEHPLFGAGLGAFRNQMIIPVTGIPLLIHSTALWLLAELGLVGFLIFAIPAVYVFVVELSRARTEWPAALAFLCCTAFAVMSGPADMLYQRTFWLLIGATLAYPPASSKSPRKWPRK